MKHTIHQVPNEMNICSICNSISKVLPSEHTIIQSSFQCTCNHFIFPNTTLQRVKRTRLVGVLVEQNFRITNVLFSCLNCPLYFGKFSLYLGRWSVRSCRCIGVISIATCSLCSESCFNSRILTEERGFLLPPAPTMLYIVDLLRKSCFLFHQLNYEFTRII